MIVPPTIKIAGIKYKVECLPNLRADDDCTGKALYATGKIQLDDSMCADMKCATLIHEVLEIIKEENQLKMSHRVLQTMATQIYQVIVDNHEVFQK